MFFIKRIRNAQIKRVCISKEIMSHKLGFFFDYEKKTFEIACVSFVYQNRNVFPL